MTKITSTIHNHTTFCDGKDSPETMILEAISRGFCTMGFSAHSYTPCDPSYCLRDTDEYFRTLYALKEKYKAQIEVLVGLEVDCYGEDDARAEYVIMSVHNVKTNNGIYVVDYSQQELERCVREDYDGDVYALVEAYYNTVLESLERPKIDVVGHLDLVTKFNDKLPIIDEAHPRYVAAITKVIEKLATQKTPLELNTGGVGRGYKKEFYPSVNTLKIIQKYGVPLCITADAHTADGIDYGFLEALSLLRKLGIKEVWQLEGKGFSPTPIDL